MVSGKSLSLAALALAHEAFAQECTSGIVIDDFTNFGNSVNLLDYWVSDDGTMEDLYVSQNTLYFTAGEGSYFYETFPCLQATTQGQYAMSFEVQGPAGGSLALELQTMESCAVNEYLSHYILIDELSGEKQTVVIPWSEFEGTPNPDAIVGMVWFDFDAGSEWSMSNLRFECDADAGDCNHNHSECGHEDPGTKRNPGSNPSDGEQPVVEEPTVEAPTAPATPGQCSNLLIDDWESQSRLTFLYYNSMLKSAGDDGSMASIDVENNRVTLTPRDYDSFFFSSVGCVDADSTYGGISLRINAPATASFDVGLETCQGASAQLSSSDLGWRFTGSEQLYSIPFSSFGNPSSIQAVTFTGFNEAVTFGPMSFYCGSETTDYGLPPKTAPEAPTATEAAPDTDIVTVLIDNFSNQASNSMGFWHGADDEMTLGWGDGLAINAATSESAFHTMLSDGCQDLTYYDNSYLHISYSGSVKFSVSLAQHNSECNEAIAPYPETWDSLEAARYSTGSDIYIPIDHFNIDRNRVSGFSLRGFYGDEATNIGIIQLVSSVPAGFEVPAKLPSGNLVFACKRPNSFAFAIDDGDPRFAQEVMEIVRSENIKVTFFTVGAPLEDPSTNLSSVYREMLSQGHQLALHSYTHPRMEGLPDLRSIDWEYDNDIAAMSRAFDGLVTPYFRPPFGVEGARMRQRLATSTGSDNPYLVMWSVDIEDWRWAETDTPDKQLEAFQRDLNKGGDLVVMHYLYESTVSYLREFIRLAKATGKDLMRVDQCMMDPNAPPL